jgi:hypothetical protein
LASGVEFGVVCCVVVAFCEELEGRCFGTVSLLLALVQRQGRRERERQKREREGTTYPLPPPNLLTTLCTIGISLPLTLYTTTSPTFVSRPLFQRNSKSPRWKAGSIDPESTTTMGEEESVVMERPFQSMNAVLSTRAKFRIWVNSWRGWREVREENMVEVAGVGG